MGRPRTTPRPPGGPSRTAGSDINEGPLHGGAGGDDSTVTICVGILAGSYAFLRSVAEPMGRAAEQVMSLLIEIGVERIRCDDPGLLRRVTELPPLIDD